MADARKKLGVFVTQPESYYQSQILYGISDEALKADMDVLIYASFIKTGGADGFQQGESNIFTLPNPEKLDAVILISDVIQMDKAKENVNKFLERFKGKVVVADNISDRYPYILSGEQPEFDGLIEHLAKHHGYKSIAFDAHGIFDDCYPNELIPVDILGGVLDAFKHTGRIVEDTEFKAAEIRAMQWMEQNPDGCIKKTQCGCKEPSDSQESPVTAEKTLLFN